MIIKLIENSAELKKHFEEALKDYQRNLPLQVFRALTMVETKIKSNIRAQFHQGTGALLNSFSEKNVTYDTDKNVVEGELVSRGVPYARILETGGSIFPKFKQALAIPMPDNTRADGMPKITTSELMNGLGSTFIHDGIIFLRQGNQGQKVTPMFVLRDRVDIPAQPYIAPALRDMQSKILQNFGLFLSASFKG